MLIVDVNHGALQLAEEYLNLGYDVDVWDIYQKIKKSDDFKIKYKKLKEKFGNRLNLFFEQPDFEKYDRIIAPIHCPIDVNFIPFTDAVSEILKEKFGDIYKKIINITGVKGKTTTTSLINHILKEKYSTYLHNSNFGSIAPPTILKVLDGLDIDKYDFFIFETSLGLVKCKYGAITNVLENYKIAGGRRDALTAKFSSLKNAEMAFINRRDIERYNLNISHKCLNVVNVDKVEILENYPLKFKYIDDIYEFNKNIFGLHFVENSLFAIEVCKNLVDMDEIRYRLKTFTIKNRMEIKEIDGKVLVKNINPGLDVKAISYAIKDFLEVFGGDIYIGGDFGVVCEEIDVKKLAEILKNFNCQYIFVGEIGKELLKYLDGKYIERFNENKINKNSLVILRERIV
ncbi:Mur ligase middle domain protein [Methanocaldococcus bathoardescens]|uniref:Mur ligase middle domain protein n=1 Tax=Methanocaldococcus bathoardescens TaxID=1301915 RepID=A0A076LE21_9EURY|nr:coenzyme F430 synthase [Methanocaldococcus bathoardescens]AIJ05017.1 Mur ligase middle domain protein [Methanocaldococcus bathoardescens]